MKQKIALIIASRGYQDVEYNTPKKMLIDAGYEVITASDALGTAVAHNESTTSIDMLISDIDVTTFTAIVFIGGPGALEHINNNVSYKLCQEAVAHHIVVAAICSATRILVAAGVLEGRMATGWNDDGKLEEIFLQSNVTYVPQEVVSEDLFITATGPHAAQEFAQHIINRLQIREDIEHE